MTITELEQCVDSYGKEIYSFCRQITGNRQEGEDLYQDTFMKAVELSDRIELSRNPKSYLLSIAVRLWKNRRRKYAWRQRIAGMESLDAKLETGGFPVGGFPAGGFPDSGEKKAPEDEILEKEESGIVRKCIQELNEKYRLPLGLYYGAELSVKEIADCLGLPEGTVKSRLHKARTLIKEKLEVAGYDR